MDKLTINRSKWCYGKLGRTMNGKFQSCAIGQYLTALGVAKEEFEGESVMEGINNIPKEGKWLQEVDGYTSNCASNIMNASDEQYEQGVIKEFKSCANINVTFKGKYPGSK